MFMAIYLPDREPDPVQELEDRSYKAYFYDERNITALAKKISGSLDPDGFADFVKTETDSSVRSICDKFRQYYPDIDAENYGRRTGKRFEDIIRTAAAVKRKRRKKAEEKPALPVETPKEKYGLYLVSEEGSVCPADNCTHLLYGKVNGKPSMIYDVVQIDPEAPPDDPDNLIALCPECAARYRLGINPLWTYRMRQIKEQFRGDTENFELISDQKLQKSLRDIIEKIPKMTPEKPPDLNYDPVELIRKIEPQHVLLYRKAKAHVNYYFQPVHEIFQEMERERILRFRPFCNQVKMNYMALKEQGLDQPTIYRLMADWLQKGTNGDRDCCEIVISYFIQKCEVFDVIAE